MKILIFNDENFEIFIAIPRATFFCSKATFSSILIKNDNYLRVQGESDDGLMLRRMQERLKYLISSRQKFMRGQKAWYICGYEHMRDDDDRTKAHVYRRV